MEGQLQRAPSIKRNYLYQSAYQLLLILVPLVTTPYLSRVLGAEQVGVYSYTYSVTNYFVMFATLGMSTYGVREIAACGSDRGARTKAFWDMYGSQLAVGVIVAVAYGLYALTNPRGGAIVTLVWGMWVLSALLDISWLFFGVQEFRMPTMRSMVTKLLSMVVIFAFVKSRDDLWVYCAAIAGSFLANQVLLWPFLCRYVGVRRPTLSGMRYHLGPNLRLFIPVIAISFYVTLDKIILGVMTDMEQVGYLEYSEKLSRMPMALVTAMGTVMLPRMTAELSAGRRREARSLLESSIWAMLAMAFAMSFGIMGIAHEFAPIFLGGEFANCDILMCIFALIIPVVSTTNVLGRQYLLPTNRDNMFTISVCIGAVVNVCVNLVLVPLLAATGAAIATVCAETSVLLVQIGVTRKELPLALYVKNAVPYAVIGAITTAIIRLVAGLSYGMWGLSVRQLVLEVLVGAVAYVAMAAAWCLVTKDPHAMPFARGIAERLGRKFPSRPKGT